MPLRGPAYLPRNADPGPSPPTELSDPLDASDESAHVGFALADEKGQLTYANEALLRMWEVGRLDDLLGSPLARLWQRPELAADLLGRLKNDRRATGEFLAKRASGETFVAQYQWEWLQAAKHQAGQIVAEFRDVGRRQDEQRRREENQARLAEAQRIAKVGNWELDLKTDRLQWSAEVYRIFGLNPAEFVPTYRSFLARVHPEDREMLDKVFVESLQSESLYQITHRIVLPDGSVRWVHERGVNHFAADGAALRCVGTVQEVTEQVETHTALRAGRDRLRAVLDSIYGFVGLLTLDGILVEANVAPFKFTRVRREETIGRALWDTPWFSYSPQVQQQIRDAVKQAADGGSVRFEIEVPIVSRERVTIDLAFEPLRDPHGTITNVIGFAVDITQRKRAEELLRESEVLTRTTLDALPARIAVLDQEGRVSHTNRAWREFPAACCTYWQAATEGMNYLQLCEGAGARGIESAASLAHAIRDVLENRVPEFSLEHDCQTTEGKQWFFTRGTRYPAPGPTRIVVAHADITSVKQAEEQMKDLRHQLYHAARVATMGEMAAGFAHELNQPLAAIRLYAEGCSVGIAGEAVSPEALQERLQEIAKLADHCGQVIRGLRQFATGHQPLREVVDIREVVRQVVQFIGHECRTSGIVCQVELPEEPIEVCINVIQIQQVLLNLIRNAVEALPEMRTSPGLIEVCARLTPDEEVEVSVADNGLGIDTETMKRIFEPFFTTKSSGLGMGLKISQSIIRTHNGRIDYHTSSGGTTFAVYLPLWKEPAA